MSDQMILMCCVCVCVFQEQLNRYERAIYASLSGNLKPVTAQLNYYSET